MHAPSAGFKYRPDIDGLRAVAVLSVVFFHAGLGATGGYVGVDVFFVISGFLITSLILRDLNNGTFSLAAFWERRVRRILPAITVCVALTLAAGWFLLLPDDLEALGNSAIAQTFFSANIFFWRTTSYFGGDIFDKPLLHTWSLSVEEQFYLFFPLLLFLLFCNQKTRSIPFLLLVLGTMFVSSLALSVWGVVNQPYATFYLLPTRAWELLVGSILALAPASAQRSYSIREFVACCGLAGILLPVFLYDETVAFPGLAALPPCLGTAALIWANNPASKDVTNRAPLAATVLSTEPIRFIGLISYSFYLYHWPVFSYANYWKMGELSVSTRWVLVAGSAALAVVSWRFVETPFRKLSPSTKRRNIFASAGVSSVAILLISVFLTYTGGYPSRLSADAIQIVESMRVESQARARFQSPLNRTPEQVDADQVHQIGALSEAGEQFDFILLGDSHAHLAVPLFEKLAFENSLSGAVITHAATPPLTGWKTKDPQGAKDAQRLFDASLDFIQRHGIRNVILMPTWAEYVEQSSPQEIEALIVETFDELRHQGLTVHLLMSPPIYDVNVPRLLLRTEFFDMRESDFPLQSPKHHKQRQQVIYQLHERLPDLKLWDPSANLLDKSTDYYMISSKGQLLYVDSSHLSQRGVELTWLPTLTLLFKELAESVQH